MTLDAIRIAYHEELAIFREQRNSNRRLWNIAEVTGYFLYKKIVEIKPHYILEIGTSNGYSTFWLSLAAEKVNAVIDSLEVDFSRYTLARSNLSGRANIRLHLGKAEDLLPALDTVPGFIFIDANKSDYLKYLQHLLPKLQPGCFIAADNAISHSDSLRDYLDFVRHDPDFESRLIKIGSGVEISLLKGKRAGRVECLSQ